MNGPRLPLFLGFMLLIIRAGYCQDKSDFAEKTDFAELRDEKTLFNLILEIINQLQKHHEEESNDVMYFPQDVDYTFDPQEFPDYDVAQKEKVEIVPRDLRRVKDKFLKHLTGPLYFSPKCNRHFYRLYHNTRDCTIPAYYKRCARLLTRLAANPMCVKGWIRQMVTTMNSNIPRTKKSALENNRETNRSQYLYNIFHCDQRFIFAYRWILP